MANRVECDLSLLSEEARERLAAGEEFVCDGNKLLLRERRYSVFIKIELDEAELTALMAEFSGKKGMLSYAAGPAISLHRTFIELDAHRRQHGS